MFWKLWKHGNGINKIRKCPLQNSNTVETGNWKLEETLFERYQNNTAIDWITLLKKNPYFYTVFQFKIS